MQLTNLRLRTICAVVLVVCGACAGEGGTAFGEGLRLAGGVDAMAKALALDGHMLYAGGGELRIYDISVPDAPVLLGRVGGMGALRQIVASKGFVYATAREYGLWIIDVTDPRAPRIRSRFDCCELATGVDIAGDVCFVGQRQNGVEFVDVSNKDAPRHIAMRKTGESQSVFYTDGLLYSGEWGVGHVTVFDAHDMRAIREIARVETWGYGDGIFAADGFLYAATGHHALHHKVKSSYVTEEMRTYGMTNPGAGMGHGLDVFDVRDPAHPKRLGRVDYPPLYTRGNDMWTPRLSGDRATVFAAQTYNGVYAVDVADKTAPKILGHWNVPNRKNPKLPGACVGSVAVGDGVVYAAVEGEGYYAVRTPRAKRWTDEKGRLPKNVSHREAYPTDESVWHVWKPHDVGQVRAVARRNDVVYAACGDAGLYALRLRPEGGFGELAKLPGHDRTFDVSVCGDLLYTADGLDGVNVSEIAGETTLRSVARLNPLAPGKTLALTVTAVAGGWLFASDRRGYDLYDVRKLPVFRHLLHAGNCPGWDKYLADAPSDGRYICYNNAHQNVTWFDLGATPDPKPGAVTSPKNRLNLTCGVCAFRDGLTLATNPGGYRILQPNEGDAADGSPWMFTPLPKGKDVCRAGIPRSDGTNVVLTCRISRKVSLFDFTDARRPVPKGSWSLSGNPDLAIFYHGRPIVPCGYQGLVMLK